MQILYNILASIPHNPHYLHRYISFIQSRSVRTLNATYVEKHHICPKAKDMFPEFASFAEFPWNCVLLNRREHILAHKLLVKTYPESIGAKAGLAVMLSNDNSKGLLKNTVVVKDSNGNKFRVKDSDSLYLSGELVGYSAGSILVRDKNDNKFFVQANDSRLFTKELVGINKDKVTVIDESGNTFQTSKYNPDYVSGKLKGATAGHVVAINSVGKTEYVSKHDERFNTRELVSLNKGKVSVKDVNGNSFQVSVDDPRYVSGELVFVLKGKAASNRKLSPCDVKTMRDTLANKSITFSKEFLEKHIKQADIQLINKKPTQELRLRNNRKADYITLLAIYYSSIHNMAPTKIKDILLCKTYST